MLLQFVELPLGAGGKSVRLKLPKETLSVAIGLSPLNNMNVIRLSAHLHVEKTWFALVGIVVFLSIIFCLYTT